MKASKKPVVIDYFPIIVDRENHDNIGELRKWVESYGDNYDNIFKFTDMGADGAALNVKTLEGEHIISMYKATKDDVIIRGVKGEYYPCKKDIFELTYDKIN